MLLALVISLICKKVIQSTLVMYGLYIVLNGLNLVSCGLMNPSDSNSISAYYLGKEVNVSQMYYSIDKAALSEQMMKVLAMSMPVIWIGVLFVGVWILYRDIRKTTNSKMEETQ